MRLDVASLICVCDGVVMSCVCRLHRQEGHHYSEVVASQLVKKMVHTTHIAHTQRHTYTHTNTLGHTFLTTCLEPQSHPMHPLPQVSHPRRP
jgi:hypothetical protein